MNTEGKQKASNPGPIVRTMNDDLEPPESSSMNLRHRRPLPKSDKMEDLRHPKTTTATSNKHHHPPPDFNRTISAPLWNQNNNSKTIIWSFIALFALIFLTIIAALVSSS